MNLLDYDLLICKRCGHLGMEPDGGFDIVCPNCGAEDSLLDESDD